MTNSKIIFVDFDGVLFDSVKEAYLLSRYAYKGISPLAVVEELEFSKFHNLRYLITKSWHFYYIWEMLETSCVDSSFFYKNIATPNVEFCKSFDEKYISARNFLIENHYDFWSKLDTPYEFFYKIGELSELSEYKIIILSNKKRFPIIDKLKKYNVKNIDVVADENINSTKSDFIKSYLFKNSYSKAYFIDDSVDNLNECVDIDGLTTLHAGWGYVNCDGLSQEEVLRIIRG